MVKVGVRKKHAIDLRLSVCEIRRSQHFLGIQTAYFRQQTKLEVIAQTVKASRLEPACEIVCTKGKRLPEVKEDFGSFVLQENLVATYLVDPTVENQLHHTQPSISFSAILILNFIDYPDNVLQLFRLAQNGFAINHLTVRKTKDRT